MTQETKMDFKKMGFATEAEYKKFLDDKMKILNEKIMENIDVFKRLADR
jgi:hypothetical protein